VKAAIRYVRKLAAIEKRRDDSDQELLRRFLDQRDEAAFAALVERHGPMVLAAGKRVLHNDHDAEDVLQATFLLFARKAGSIRRAPSVGSWLYGVAYRLALKLRAQTARQRTQERRIINQSSSEDGLEVTLKELQSLLDEELHKLPEKYRAPILLCCLEGKTRDEAALELGWKVGAVKIRLERGRELLRKRLLRRGVSASAVLLSSFLAPSTAAAVPLRLTAATVEASIKFAAGETAAEIASSTALTLVQTTLRTLAFARIRTLIGAGAALGLLGLGLAFAIVGHSLPKQTANNHRLVAIKKSEQSDMVAAFPAGPEETAGQQQPGPTIRGTLASTDLAKRTITVRRGEQKNQTFSANEAKVLIDGREVTLDDLKTSWRVALEISRDESSVRIIRVEGPTVTGTVHNVSVADGTITVLHGDNGRSASSFPVMENVRAELSRTTIGSRITLRLTLDRKNVVQIISAAP